MFVITRVFWDMKSCRVLCGGSPFDGGKINTQHTFQNTIIRQFKCKRKQTNKQTYTKLKEPLKFNKITYRFKKKKEKDYFPGRISAYDIRQLRLGQPSLLLILVEDIPLCLSIILTLIVLMWRIG